MMETVALDWTIRNREGWTFGSSRPEIETSASDSLELLAANAVLPGRAKNVVNDRFSVEQRFESMEGEAAESIFGESVEGISMTVDEVVEQVLEAGWKARQEDDKTIRVLPEGNPGTVIMGQFLPEGGFRFSLSFASSIGTQEELGRSQKQARALLLLRLGAEFRLIKPVLRSDEYELEVSFPASGPTDPGHIRHALGSLSIAAQSAQQEFAALADSRVASAYLSFHRVSKTQN